jgi:hypothetical protein
MNTIKLLLLACAAAILLSACQPPANNSATNSNANSNANANRSATATAPTKDALMALDRNAFEAWKNKDTKFWDTYISSRFAAVEPGGKIDKAEVLKHFAEDNCEVKSYSLSDDQMMPLGTDAALLTYKASADATCGGKQQPRDAWVATVFVREGDSWKPVFHGENPINAAGSDNNNAAKPAAPPAKPAANWNSNANSANANTATASAPKPDAATEAMFDLEKKAWDAWKNKDAKTLDEWAGTNLVAFTTSGRQDHAGAIKTWTEEGCDVKSVSLTDPSGVSLGPDYGLLLFKASTDGKCQGSAIPPEYGASIYGKEAGTWKALFTMGNDAAM